MNDAHTVVENAMKTHNSIQEWSEGELNTLLKLKRKNTISKLQDIQMKHNILTGEMKELLGKYEMVCKERETLLNDVKLLTDNNQILKERIQSAGERQREEFDKILKNFKEAAKEIADLKETNRQLGKELSLYKSSNTNGTTTLMCHGTEYIITITNDVYRVVNDEPDTEIAGTFRECEDYRRATMIHNGWKGFIEWERDHPIKTCEINPSMNGLSH
jgi:seryl-tRNA synthetase